MAVYASMAMVRSPIDDPAHRIVNAKGPAKWNHRQEPSNSSWLAQLVDHLKEWSMGPAQARAVAQNRPREWSRKVSAAKCRRGTCCHTWPDLALTIVFVGISREFGRLSHRGLYNKLSSYGLFDSIRDWIFSFLPERSQRTCVGGWLWKGRGLRFGNGPDPIFTNDQWST